MLPWGNCVLKITPMMHHQGTSSASTLPHGRRAHIADRDAPQKRQVHSVSARREPAARALPICSIKRGACGQAGGHQHSPAASKPHSTTLTPPCASPSPPLLPSSASPKARRRSAATTAARAPVPGPTTSPCSAFVERTLSLAPCAAARRLRPTARRAAYVPFVLYG